MKGSKSSALTIKGVVSTLLWIGLLLGSYSSQAAPLKARAKPAPKAQPAINIYDMDTWTQSHPQKCKNDKNAEPGWPLGWGKSPAQCVWHQHLRMQQWFTEKDNTPATCVSKIARWWAWSKSGQSTALHPVWNRAWSRQSHIEDVHGQKRIRIIDRTEGGAWLVTQWTWIPPVKAASRRWQEEHLKPLITMATSIQQSLPKERMGSETTALRKTWEASLKGTPAEISGENWFWQHNGVCLRMETVGLSKAQLYLPYSKEDGRLEQRAAMQLRLARTYPKAIWLTTFQLLPLPAPLMQSGAKYEAIWVESTTVTGQLWIPIKDEGGILRARIAVDLPAQKNSDADAALITRASEAIHHELVSLATTWILNYEH